MRDRFSPTPRRHNHDHGSQSQQVRQHPAHRCIPNVNRQDVFAAASSKVFNKNQAGEFAELTKGELGILDLIAAGHNNAVIANKLSPSIKAVQNYVSSILTKLQVAERAEAIKGTGRRPRP